MPSPRGNRFTIYDKLDNDGAFSSNPANPFARGPNGENLYSGPQPFPQMLYHPEGQMVVTVPGEIMSTPLGAQRVGEQRELVNKVVGSQAELDEALAEGWHTHPSPSNRARIEAQLAAGQIDEMAAKRLLAALPLANPLSKLKELEDELAKLKAERVSPPSKASEITAKGTTANV